MYEPPETVRNRQKFFRLWRTHVRSQACSERLYLYLDRLRIYHTAVEKDGVINVLYEGQVVAREVSSDVLINASAPTRTLRCLSTPHACVAILPLVSTMNT